MEIFGGSEASYLITVWYVSVVENTLKYGLNKSLREESKKSKDYINNIKQQECSKYFMIFVWNMTWTKTESKQRLI